MLTTVTLLAALALGPPNLHSARQAEIDEQRRQEVVEYVRAYQHRVRRAVEMQTLFWMSVGAPLAHAASLAANQVCATFDAPEILAKHGVDCRDGRVTYREPQ